MSSLFNSSNLDHPEEEHDEDEDPLDKPMDPYSKILRNIWDK